MASTIDEISINYEEDGAQLVKEINKEILTRGAWTTILFQYQEWDKHKSEYGPMKYSIRRYQKRNNVYLPKSKFNISNDDQGKKIIDVLSRWIEGS